ELPPIECACFLLSLSPRRIRVAPRAAKVSEAYDASLFCWASDRGDLARKSYSDEADRVICSGAAPNARSILKRRPPTKSPGGLRVRNQAEHRLLTQAFRL